MLPNDIPPNGISTPQRLKSIEVLEALLPGETSLYVKTRKFHWNVSGPGYMKLHHLFKTQYTALEEIIHAAAGHLDALTGKTSSKMKEFTASYEVKESPDHYPMISEMIKELSHDHELLLQNLRKDIDLTFKKEADTNTLDFLTGVMELHETTVWALRRYFKHSSQS